MSCRRTNSFKPSHQLVFRVEFRILSRQNISEAKSAAVEKHSRFLRRWKRVILQDLCVRHKPFKAIIS